MARRPQHQKSRKAAPVRKWAPSGLATLGPGLSEIMAEEISVILGKHRKKLTATANFMDEIDRAIQLYHAMKENAEESSPASVRRHMDAVIQAIQQYCKARNALDINAIQLITIDDPNALRSFDDALSRFSVDVAQARNAADDYSNRGDLPDFAKTQFAAHIAYAMREYLELRPTSTEGGILYEISNAILRSIEGVSVSAPRSPIGRDNLRRAIKVDVTGGPGTVFTISKPAFD